MSEESAFERSTNPMGRFSSSWFGEAAGRYMVIEASRHGRIEFTRVDASLDVKLQFAPDHARAIAAELIAAADWIEAQA